ncbi:MAG TPA: adenylate kinase [Gaiellaceae bacterium]|nr:adenylate kinase [Gaiellaceae bacterium]
MNILLLGVQGAGKGTQAKRIAAEYELPHVSTGDMFRAAVAAQSELGRRVAPILERGELVPDELTIALIRERLAEEDARNGVVLDGFPRTVAQASALDAMLGEEGRRLDVVLELQVSDDVAMERMLSRAQLEGRIDDTPEVIARRLAIYHEETEPIVEYYRAQGIVVGLHGERTIDEVFAEIQAALEAVEARA